MTETKELKELKRGELNSDSIRSITKKELSNKIVEEFVTRMETRI